VSAADTTPETVTRRRQVKPLSAAKTPVGPGIISALGLLWSALLLGVGVVGVQAALVAAGVLNGTAWLTWVIQQVDGLAPAGWMLPVGVVLVLFGLWLLLTALRPRPRTAVALTAATGVFLKPRDLSRLAVAAADQVDGVQDAKASASRSKVSMQIVSTGGGNVADEVRAAVTERLEALEKPVKVTVRTQGGPR
jgi:hypothetical protein